MSLAEWHQVRNKIGRDYYLIGNGYITGLVQIDRSGPGAPLCLLLQDPHYFGLNWAYKEETYLFDQEKGLEDTQLTVTLDGREFTPARFNVSETWRKGNQPILDVHWWAGFVRVTETFFASTTQPVLFRRVTLENRGLDETDAWTLLPFVPNAKQFSPACIMGDAMICEGKAGSLGMGVVETGRCVVETRDQQIAIQRTHLAPGQSCTMTYAYAYAQNKETVTVALQSVAKEGVENALALAAASTTTALQLKCEDKDVMHLANSAVRGLSAAPSAKGRVNAGIWQYNAEWVRDSSMIALGCTHLGLHDNAKRIFTRILKWLVSSDGRTCIGGRFDETPPDQNESDISGGFPRIEHEQYDQAGALLYALKQYWLWTGDSDLIRENLSKILALAKRLADAPSRDSESGMYHNTREYWERNSIEHGIEEGYELAYQIWPVLGLRAIPTLAKAAGDASLEAKLKHWLSLADQTWNSTRNHPKLRLVNNGRLVKRRCMDGSIQETARNTRHFPLAPQIPLGNEKRSFLEPCSSMTLPIAFGLLAADDPLAEKTLDFVEQLWNLRWEHGGYDRYHSSSQCDTPGPWPFASMFITRANHKAGHLDRSLRTVRWMATEEGGRAGVWHENIPITADQGDWSGIVPWIWGEIGMFIVGSVLGIEPREDGVFIRPASFAEMGAISATVLVRGKKLTINCGVRETRCRLDEGPWIVVPPEGTLLKY